MLFTLRNLISVITYMYTFFVQVSRSGLHNLFVSPAICINLIETQDPTRSKITPTNHRPRPLSPGTYSPSVCAPNMTPSPPVDHHSVHNPEHSPTYYAPPLKISVRIYYLRPIFRRKCFRQVPTHRETPKNVSMSQGCS